MGVTRFIVHPADLMARWPEVHRGYMAGVDGTIWPCRIETDGNQVLCRRQVSDSGKFHVPWPVAGHGRVVTSTASLRDRVEPYLLPVELARGKIVHIRNQSAAWHEAGLTVPSEYWTAIRQAQSVFAKSVAGQVDPVVACRLADEALVRAFDAANVLTRAQVSHRLERRKKQYDHLPVLLGSKLGSEFPSESDRTAFVSAFNAIAVPTEWRVIEPTEGEYNWEPFDQQLSWAEREGLAIRGGPLLDLSPNGLPKWLWNWIHDFLSLKSFVADSIETTITRYSGRIRAWEVVARANTGGALALNEEQRLTLAAKALEVARQSDPESELIIRIDQPWGEYQVRGQHKLTPLQFADALLRAGLGLSAINLEIAVGYTPRSSGHHDLLDFSRMIDLWSTLGVPLRVTLACPSSPAIDKRVFTDLEVGDEIFPGGWTEDTQAAWVRDLVPMLLAKPAVMAVFWSHLNDGREHRFPNSGLIRDQGGFKPAFGEFKRLLETYWNF